jgi:hypothetical protein
MLMKALQSTETVFRFPRFDQRTFVTGRTGSGKTVFGLWLLSAGDLARRPWLIFDYKLDSHLAKIQRSRDLGVHDKLPKLAGLYHLRLTPGIDDDAVENLLRRVWRCGNIGLYFDEGYSVPQGPWKSGFRTIMTQGRSLGISAIVLTQRPVWIDKFAMSEADFYAIFHLNQKDDRKRVGELLPDDATDIDERLDEYHCRWYDVVSDKLCYLKPAPAPEKSIAAIDAKLKPKRNWI